MLLLCKQQQYKKYKTDHYDSNVDPKDFCSRMMLCKTWGQGHSGSLADINIPIPLPNLVPFFGYYFSIFVTVAILGFMTTSLFAALVVTLLSVHVPQAVTRFPVSVVTAAVGLISVVVVTAWGIVVPMFMGIVFFWLHIGRVSALLGFRVKCLLPGEASTCPTAVVVVCG